jgi:MinD superfamily P-loop ATPase
MIISIASGKGGTGKTTIATNLASAIRQPVRFLDCDVEEPNAHLFIRLSQLETEVVDTMVPEVDEGLCDLCGLCGEICRFSAILPVGGKVMVFPELCHSCRGCEFVCPRGAVRASSRPLGEIVHGRSGQIDLYYGRLRIGEAMSPPLIAALKKRVDRQGLTIIDAPPGTSCPVAATLQGSDFVMLVTEPTPFGLNDLKLAVETVRVLGLPMGIVINRSNIGDDAVERYAVAEGIPILMQIPHRQEIAESYSKGVLLIQALPEMRREFRDLFQSVTDLVAEQKRVIGRAV